MVVEKGAASPRELAFGLLQSTAPAELEPLLKNKTDLTSVYKDIVEELRQRATVADGAVKQASSTSCSACSVEDDLTALGERVVQLEELEEVVRLHWSNRDDRTAVHRKLLLCGIDSPQSLLRSITPQSGKEGVLLNALLEEAGFKGLRSDTRARLVADLEPRVFQRLDFSQEGSQPILTTAPHNIFLCRDGWPPHAMEEYTTLIAQRLARRLGGSCISWTRAEQHRSELLWNLGRCREAGDKSVSAGSCLDPRNRDPNFLSSAEVMQNGWFRHVLQFAEDWRDPTDGRLLPMLHIDIHGCRDPPASAAHVTVGLAAMRHEAESGRGWLTVCRVEAFAEALEAELSAVLTPLTLRPRADATVLVLRPSLSAPEKGASGKVERFSGAWPLSIGRMTQAQQAVAYAGFSHACQLELSKALRKLLAKDDALVQRFGRAILKAWVSSAPVLPKLSTAVR
eukprot:TRINITY_DN53133_c0_g1_i1.p1 TRINITY_DN53133_c0_g1~~TRINITY_DN53133_c0_g1_i1.p1  ORF type:complete len:455 (+),score=94.24 TRINITY_DN53133_c0_g1_i1:523-1887(+)